MEVKLVATLKGTECLEKSIRKLQGRCKQPASLSTDSPVHLLRNELNTMRSLFCKISYSYFSLFKKCSKTMVVIILVRLRLERNLSSERHFK